MIIHDVTTEDLATVIAGLVRQGLTFDVHPSKNTNLWRITLTGGY